MDPKLNVLVIDDNADLGDKRDKEAGTTVGLYNRDLTAAPSCSRFFYR